jgi:hypothetical protein
MRSRETAGPGLDGRNNLRQRPRARWLRVEPGEIDIEVRLTCLRGRSSSWVEYSPNRMIFSVK